MLLPICSSSSISQQKVKVASVPSKNLNLAPSVSEYLKFFSHAIWFFVRELKVFVVPK